MSIEDKQISSIYKIREFYKELYDETPTSEDAFRDVYNNGQYHNSSAVWRSLASGMGDEMAIDCAQYVIYALLTGTVEARNGANLELLMEFHEAIVRWSEHRSKKPDELIQLCDKIKLMLIELKPGEKPWFLDVIRHHSLFHMAIVRRTRASILDLDSEYNRIIDDNTGKW